MLDTVDYINILIILMMNTSVHIHIAAVHLRLGASSFYVSSVTDKRATGVREHVPGLLFQASTMVAWTRVHCSLVSLAGGSQGWGDAQLGAIWNRNSVS